MATPNVEPRIQYVCDGRITKFSCHFAVFGADDLEIYVNDERKLLSVDYVVDEIEQLSGGSITFLAPPALGSILTIRRKLVLERVSDFQPFGEFRASTINREFDYQTAALQELAFEINRTIRLRPTDADANLELPDKTARLNKTLGFDADGNIAITEALVERDLISDHGQLSGLSDDDHPQYHTPARANQWLGGKTTDNLAEGATNKYFPGFTGSGTTSLSARADHHHVGVYSPAIHTHSASELTDAGDFYGKSVGPSLKRVGGSVDLDISGQSEEHAPTDEWLLVERPADGTLRKINVSKLVTSAGGGSSAWGDITGTLADQTDLRTALDGKSSTSHNHSGVYEPVFAKNTGFNKNFGTSAGTVAEGSHNHDAVYAPIAHASDINNPHSVTKSQVGLGEVANLKVNLAATADPTATDDSNAGYAVGSRWVNAASDKEFVLLDATPSAAVWKETTAVGGGSSAWGDITGTLADQTDLRTALDGKSSTSHNHSDVYEPVFAKNTGFNKNFGTSAGTVAEGSHNHDAVYAPIAHASDINNPHSVTKSQVGLGEVANLKVKLDATAAPAVTNDAASGYAVGSRWFDVTNDREYVCLDATAGAAIWIETTQAGGGSGLPTGVTTGTGIDGDALLKLQAQAISGELQQWKNNAGTDVGGINTDDAEQLQIILKDKSGPVMFAATAGLGLQLGEHATPPPTPSTARVALYADANGRLKAKDDAGREAWLSADYDEIKAVTTTPYSVLATDRTIICSGSADVLNLPAAAGAGKRWEISNYTGSDITINRAGAETIRKGATTGATSITVANGNTVSVRDIAIGTDEFDVIGQYT